jgi:UDP-glucose 4-epimerase
MTIDTSKFRNTAADYEAFAVRIAASDASAVALLAPRRVLVWGARGFIGRHLVADLLERGYDVRVLARASCEDRPLWGDSVEWAEFDDGDAAGSFARALDRVDAVFNLAGSSGAVTSNREPLASLDANCRVQLEFLGACARLPRAPHVVFASSRLVYAQAGRQPLTEQSSLAPLSMYAAHKLCVEHYHRIYAKRHAISFTVCRISNPYGLDGGASGKGYGFVNAMIQRALNRQPLTLFGSGRQLRDYIYIDDLVTCLRLCIDRREARNETINVGLGESVSMLDAAREIERALGGGPIEHQPWPAEYEAVESGDCVLDVSHARTLLAYAPRFSFATGIAEVRMRAALGALATVSGVLAPSQRSAGVVDAAVLGAASTHIVPQG